MRLPARGTLFHAVKQWVVLRLIVGEKGGKGGALEHRHGVVRHGDTLDLIDHGVQKAHTAHPAFGRRFDRRRHHVADELLHDGAEDGGDNAWRFEQ